MCGVTLRQSLVSLFLAVLFSVAAISWAGAQETNPSPPSGPSTISESQNQTPSWEAFGEILTMLEAEAESSRKESIEQLNRLLESQTEANELRRSLGLSEQSLKAFERSMEAERAAAAAALGAAIRKLAAARQRVYRWRVGFWVAAGAAAAGVGWAALK
jgi:hypothetical protein